MVIKGDLDPVGVPLVSGWFAVSQTIIPEAQEHLLTPSTRRHTHLFGGLELTRYKFITLPAEQLTTLKEEYSGSGCSNWDVIIHRFYVMQTALPVRCA